MTNAAQFKPDLTVCDAFAASMRVWLVALLAWFLKAADVAASHAARRHPAARCLAGIVARYAPHLRAHMRQAADDLRRALFLYAFARLDPRPPPPYLQKSNAPPGFRHIMVRHDARRIVSSALAGLHAGSLRQRARRFLRILDTLESVIARVLRRLSNLMHCPRRARLVLIHAPRDALIAAPAAAPCAADTS